MRRFSGRGGAVFAAGEPFRFRDLPLADCGDGFTWRSADDTLRCWVDASPLTFEVFEHGSWGPVQAESVQATAGTVSFGRCLTSLYLRASGVAVPTTLVAEAQEWTLEQPVIPGRSFDGPTFGLGRATATLTGISDAALAALPAIRRVFTVLPSGAAGVLVGLGELARDAAGLKVIIDSEGVTHALY